MTTSVDVANMALDLLTEGQIESLEDDSRPARLINRWYDVLREAELTKHAWSFARIFPDDIDAVDSGNEDAFRYVYATPSDMLRPLWVTEDGMPDGVPLMWTLWADGIRSSYEGPLKLPYIGNLIDPDDWNALFTLALAAAIATTIAHPLTGKASMIQVAQNAYDRAIDDARRVNVIQQIGSYSDRSWAAQRGDTRYWRA